MRPSILLVIFQPIELVERVLAIWLAESHLEVWWPLVQLWDQVNIVVRTAAYAMYTSATCAADTQMIQPPLPRRQTLAKTNTLYSALCRVVHCFDVYCIVVGYVMVLFIDTSYCVLSKHVLHPLLACCVQFGIGPLNHCICLLLSNARVAWDNAKDFTPAMCAHLGGRNTMGNVNTQQGKSSVCKRVCVP